MRRLPALLAAMVFVIASCGDDSEEIDRLSSEIEQRRQELEEGPAVVVPSAVTTPVPTSSLPAPSLASPTATLTPTATAAASQQASVPAKASQALEAGNHLLVWFEAAGLYADDLVRTLDFAPDTLPETDQPQLLMNSLAVRMSEIQSFADNWAMMLDSDSRSLAAGGFTNIPAVCEDARHTIALSVRLLSTVARWYELKFSTWPPADVFASEIDAAWTQYETARRRSLDEAGKCGVEDTASQIEAMTPTAQIATPAATATAIATATPTAQPTTQPTPPSAPVVASTPQPTPTPTQAPLVVSATATPAASMPWQKRLNICIEAWEAAAVVEALIEIYYHTSVSTTFLEQDLAARRAHIRDFHCFGSGVRAANEAGAGSAISCSNARQRASIHLSSLSVVALWGNESESSYTAAAQELSRYIALACH